MYTRFWTMGSYTHFEGTTCCLLRGQLKTLKLPFWPSNHRFFLCSSLHRHSYTTGRIATVETTAGHTGYHSRLAQPLDPIGDWLQSSPPELVGFQTEFWLVTTAVAVANYSDTFTFTMAIFSHQILALRAADCRDPLEVATVNGEPLSGPITVTSGRRLGHCYCCHACPPQVMLWWKFLGCIAGAWARLGGLVGHDADCRPTRNIYSTDLTKLLGLGFDSFDPISFLDGSMYNFWSSTLYRCMALS